jgi:hypothetical protein
MGAESSLAFLAERLSDARARTGSIRLVAGEAGIGKTSSSEARRVVTITEELPPDPGEDDWVRRPKRDPASRADMPDSRFHP